MKNPQNLNFSGTAINPIQTSSPLNNQTNDNNIASSHVITRKVINTNNKKKNKLWVYLEQYKNTLAKAYLYRHNNKSCLNYEGSIVKLRTQYIENLFKVILKIGLIKPVSPYFKLLIIYNKIIVDFYLSIRGKLRFESKLKIITPNKKKDKKEENNEILRDFGEKNDQEIRNNFILDMFADSHKSLRSEIQIFHSFCLGYEDYNKISEETVYSRIENALKTFSKTYFNFNDLF